MDLRSGRYTGDWMTNLGEPAFPTELWEHIFGFLPGLSLCAVRQVCRRWRDIVGSRLELLNRLLISLERLDESDTFIMDEDFVCPPMLPVPNIILENWDILAINWWPDISWKLREASIFRCTVQVPTLMNMLEQSPNLRTLRLRAVWLRAIDPVQDSFRLEGMRQLTMDSIHYDGLSDAEMIDTFVKVFPRLEDFQMRIPTSLVILIRVVTQLRYLTSLEVIPKRAEDSLLPTLCQLGEPRLKRLSFDTRDTFCKEDWDQLHQAQPLLEELIVDVDRNMIMLDIARSAPTLKALSLYLVRSIPMNFLNELPQLRFLEINGYTYDRYAPLPLGEPADPIRCPALRVFRLFQMTFVGFLEFFAHSPHIESILLEDVKLEHPPDSAPEISLVTFPYLRHLDITDCFSVKAVLIHVFSNSPLLERVRLLHVTEIDDETIEVLCQRATRLRKLEIDQCLGLSDATGRHIIEHCAELQDLRLYLNRLSLGMLITLKALKRTRNIRVWYSYCQELEIAGEVNA